MVVGGGARASKANLIKLPPPTFSLISSHFPVSHSLSSLSNKMSRRTAISATRKLSSFLFSTPPFPRKLPSSYSQHLLHHHFHTSQTPFSMTSHLHHHNSIAMISSSFTLHQFFSSSYSSSSSSSSPNPLDDSDPAPKNPNPNSASEMKHLEIEGPTVDRDLSPLANESREVTTSLLKTMYNLTKVLAILGLTHLCLGTYTYVLASASSSSPSSPLLIQMCVMSAIAFGFAFSLAFMLRQCLKHMHFFQKMEQIGRLQILTSTMQISKNLLLFFFRLRAISYLCVAGLSFSFIYSLSSSL